VIVLATGERSFQYRGDLAETGLPEILHTIDRFQVPGLIEAERDGVVKRVFIKEGRVVHASSTDRDDSLGAFLLRTGRLTGEQVTVTMRERSVSDKRHGVLLVEAGLLTPRAVHDAIRQHIEAIVWSLFSWPDGRVTFSLGEATPDESMRVDLPMRYVVLEGIKQAPNARAFVARLGKRDTVFEPCWETEGLIELALAEEDHHLIGLVDGQRTLYDVCVQGPLAPADNAKRMYAFQVLQLIRKARVSENVSPAPPREARPGAIKIRLKTPGRAFAD
jgi:hypothetical protein